MAIRSVILFIGVYFVFVKAADAEHAKLGGKITLVPTVTGEMDDILWKHNGNKVVEFDGSQNKEFGSYVGRTVLDFVTGELIISDLTTEDSGHYELEAHINNLLKYSQHQVEVIAEVAQPTIICVVNDAKTTPSMATLQCNADPKDQQSPMTYSWEGLEGTFLNSLSIDQKLSIAVKDRHDEAVFQCSVSNIVSKKQAQFQVKNCFTDESSSTVLAICLSLLCLVILLILAVLALWFYKRHKKAESAVDVENPLKQAKPALKNQDGVDDPLIPGQVKEKRQLFERLARQQIPTKGRLDDQNRSKKQENIKRTEHNSHRATLPSTQPLPQQAQSEEKRSDPPTPSQASMKILQPRPEQETVPDQDPAESVGVSLPDQKTVVAVCEDGLQTRDGETERKTNDGGIVKDALDQNGEAIRKTEQKREHNGSESSPVSTLSPKDDQINGSTPDSAAVSKPAEPSQVQPEPDDSKAVRDVDLCQQKPNTQSGSISPGGVVGSEEGSKEAEEGIKADVEKVGNTEQQSMKGHVKEKVEKINAETTKEKQNRILKLQQAPKKGRLDDQNGSKKQENIERTEDNSHRATFPSTQALLQQAQSEEKKSDPPTPSHASTKILQPRPEQETVPDQDPAESVEVSLPDQKTVVAACESITKEPTDQVIPDLVPGPTGETGHQEQQDTGIVGQTGLLTDLKNPTQAVSEPEAPKNQLDTNTDAKTGVPAQGHQDEISESCSTSSGGEEGDEDGLETRDGETKQKTNDGGIVKDAMDQNGEEIGKTEQEREHNGSESSPFSTLSPKDDQINASTPDSAAVSKPAEPSQVQPEPNQSEQAQDLSQQAEDSAQSPTKPTDTSTPKLTNDTQPLTPTQPSAECNRSDPPSPSQASMIQSDQNILQPRPEQETVPDQDPAESVKVSLPDQKTVVAACVSITKKPTDPAISDLVPGPTCPTKQDTGAGETGHQEQPDTGIVGQTGLLTDLKNPTQAVSEPEAPKNQLDTNTDAKTGVPAQGHQDEISESCSTSSGGEEGDEDGLETRDGETKQKTNDGGIVKDAMDQNGEEIGKTEQEREHNGSESSPFSTLSPKDDQINASTPDSAAVSKPAEPSQVQPEPNQSEQAQDLSQQAEDSAQSPTKPTDTSTPKLTNDTQPLTPTQPSAECNRSDPPSPSQASMIQSDQNILQPRPEQETVPDQDPAESVKVSLPDQKTVVAACVSITKKPTDPAISDLVPGPTCPTKQDTGAGETGHQEQPDTGIVGQTGLLTDLKNPTQAVSEPEAPKNQLDTNTDAKTGVPAQGHQDEISESCSTSSGGEEGDEDGLETRDGETKQKTNDGGIVKDAMDQNGEEIGKTEQEREHNGSESSPFSTLSPKDDQINASTPDSAAVSKPAEPSQVQPEPNQSEQAQDLSQQAEDSAQSPTKPTDTSTPKLTNDTQPLAPTPTQPSAECNRSDPPSPSQASMIQSDQNILQPRPEQETVPDQDPAESVEVSLSDQKTVVAVCEDGLQTRDGETERKTNDGGIVKDALDQNGEEIGKTEQEREHNGSESSPFSTLSPKDDQIYGSTPDTVAVSKPAELSQVQPEPDDSKAVRNVDLCQQKPNSQSGSISPGGVVESEEGSKEAEEEMEARDVEKNIPEGGGDHSIGIDGNMETVDEENKKSFEVGDTKQQSMKEEKTGTGESAEQHPDPGKKANVSSQ